MSDSENNKNKFFRQIDEYIDKMPSLSTTATKVIEVCNQPDPSPHELALVISLDPVLTGQVLKLINSAYFSLTHKITTLIRAIIMLGMNTVKNMALSTSIMGTMSRRKASSLEIADFWAHSLGVAVTAKVLAKDQDLSYARQEEHFMAGLLHDLGKLPMDGCFASEYAQVLSLAEEEQIPLTQTETTIFGFNHGGCGHLIIQKWQLSSPILEAVSHHHELEKVENCSDRDLVALVELANIFVNRYQIGCAGDSYPDSSHNNMIFELTGSNWSELEGMHEMVLDEIEKAQIFLQIAGSTKI